MLIKLLVIIVSLILIGILANYSGKLVELIKLPSLIGMILLGMFVGPSFLNLIPQSTLNISPYIKDIALVTVLFIGGLGISINQMKQIGRPAILLSIIPATLEGLTIAFLSMIFLNFTFVQGAILGFIIAAVSPAVLVPSMVDLIKRKIGQDKAIPQMLLVGASADDTVAITLFTTFLGIYMSSNNGQSISIASELFSIPITIFTSIFIGWLLAFLTKKLLKSIKINTLRVILTFIICLLQRRTILSDTTLCVNLKEEYSFAALTVSGWSTWRTWTTFAEALDSRHTHSVIPLPNTVSTVQICLMK